MGVSRESTRIHLLPAKDVPVVIVIRRKPSKLFHILKWNTREDTLESGSWFKGTVVPFKSDVSFDGKWMVYLAMGASGETWSGICSTPWLKTSSDWSYCGFVYGGGYWARRDRLLISEAPFRDKTGDDQYPFTVEELAEERTGLGSVLYRRMERDGWERVAKETGNSDWVYGPTSKHPTLRAIDTRHFELNQTFRFSIDEYPSLLDSDVTWATWDADGNLVFAKRGALVKYALEDIGSERPTFTKDLENLRKESPERRS